MQQVLLNRKSKSAMVSMYFKLSKCSEKGKTYLRPTSIYFHKIVYYTKSVDVIVAGSACQEIPVKSNLA